MNFSCNLSGGFIKLTVSNFFLEILGIELAAPPANFCISFLVYLD